MIPWVLSTEFKVDFVLFDCTWSSSEVEDEKEALTHHSDTGAVCLEHLVPRITQGLGHWVCTLSLG